MTTLLQPIIDSLNVILSFFEGFTHDYGIAVILLTLLIRSLLFTFNVRAARQQVRQSRAQPYLAQMRSKFAGDTKAMSQEMMRIYAEFGIKPMSMLWAGLIQAPIFISIIHLFNSHGAMMTSSIIPWVSSLGQADPLHIIPLIYVAVTWVSMMIPLTADITMTGSMLLRAGLPAVMVGVMGVVVWTSPIAVGIYWTTNALFAIMERGFYRTHIGRRLVNKGLPATAT